MNSCRSDQVIDAALPVVPTMSSCRGRRRSDEMLEAQDMLGHASVIYAEAMIEACGTAKSAAITCRRNKVWWRRRLSCSGDVDTCSGDDPVGPVEDQEGDKGP